MLSLLNAVVVTVASACVLFLNDNSTIKNTEEKAKSIVECIVANTITNDEMALIATHFNVSGYLVVNNGNTSDF